jgi:GAF domain-containing protein
MRWKDNATLRYATYGVLFGLLFPVFSTALDLYILEYPLTLASVVQVQLSNPLHWVIDTAPLFLGLFASMAGRRQDQLARANERLQREIAERERALRELGALQAGLELQVAKQTADLTTAAEVGRAAASILNLERLAREVVELVRGRFDLHYVGLFLLDESGEHALLEAGTGEPGRIMKEQGHKLVVGGVSMVGVACAQRQARITQEAGDEPIRFDNPLLPDTRSEAALPLLVGDRVLGALDVQSVKPSAFSTQDIAVLQLVADQVAVAVDNARKFSREAELLEATSPLFRVSRRLVSASTTAEIVEAIIASISETEADGCLVGRLNASPGGEAETITFLGDWSRHWASRFAAGMTFSAIASPIPLQVATRLWRIEDSSKDAAVPNGLRLFLAGYGGRAFVSVPLRIGERIVGFLAVYRTGAEAFSSVSVRMYETLADQAAVAMERARLLEEARARAARERLIAAASARMRETLDVEAVLKTAVDEIAGALGLTALDLRLGTDLEPGGDGSPMRSAPR